MEMTIEDVIHELESITRFYKNLWGTDDYDNVIKTHEIAINTMRKYQKIEEAYKKYLNDMVTNIYADRKFIKVLKEVLEDGKID